MSCCGHPVFGSNSEDCIEVAGRLQSRRTVLLVEDGDPLRDSLENLLKHLGYVVISVSEGAAAVSLAQQGIEFDLVLTDLSMSEAIDGLKWASAIQTLRPEMPVLYLSSYPMRAPRRMMSLDSTVQ